jgi:hypothetical protein
VSFILKYKKYLVIGFYLVVFLFGFKLGGCFNQDKKTSADTTSSKETFHSETLKPGKPDTTYTPIRLELKDKVKKEDINYGPVYSNTGVTTSWAAWSTFEKNIASIDGNIHVGVTTYPGIDSANVTATYTGVKREIKQTDILEKKDSVKSDVKSTVTAVIEAKSHWGVSAGVAKTFIENSEAIKYVDLNYSHKVWFFNITAGAGVCNSLNDGLKGIQTHAKLELNIVF